MNSEEIRQLDRTKTVILIPGGILEEHGPYLPSYTDGYWNEQVTHDLAKAIDRTGRSVVVSLPIPLGNSGANDIGGKFSFPGTYAVRFTTLRAVFLDLATELGEQGSGGFSSSTKQPLHKPKQAGFTRMVWNEVGPTLKQVPKAPGQI
jgi:creatinine amidohydrolase/Fe(II)-dependent formamide hydrolase-like protein